MVDTETMLASAQSATDRGDWDAAVREWAGVRQADPENEAAYLNAGWALRELNRLDEADKVLQEGMRLVPFDPWMATHRAWVAMRRQDWNEAAQRWEFIRGRFPEHPRGYIEGGWALREAGRFDEADAVLRVGMLVAPDDPWMAIHYAWVAHNRPDWEEAADRWAAIREKFPAQMQGYVDGGWALIEANRLPEADKVLALAVEKYPDSYSAAFHYARVAQTQERWREAVARWRAARDRFPNTGIETELSRALGELQRTTTAARRPRT